MEQETQEKLQQLQTIEQNLQAYGVQKQTIQGHLLEAESAQKEMGGSKEVFRIVGNIMVKADPKKLKQELDEKVKVFRSQLETIERQEKRLKGEAEQFQKEIMEGMK